MLARLLESNLAYGFYDIQCYFRQWVRLIQLGDGYLSSGDECMQVKQAEHDFFTGLALTMGSRENGYEVWYEKYC